MNKTTKYTVELLRYIDRKKDPRAMVDWIQEQPDLDQPEILRELNTILTDRFEKTGDKNWLEIANYIEKGVDDFEENILDEKLHKALFMMQFDKVEFETEKVILFLSEARKSIIETILSNPENIKEVKKLARLAIKLEKETGIYDPANWIEIL